MAELSISPSAPPHFLPRLCTGTRPDSPECLSCSPIGGLSAWEESFHTLAWGWLVSKYADVAIPLGVDRVFTYLVPAEFAPQAEPGKRVVVPFGKKLVTGLIVALPSNSSVSSLKSLVDIVDPAPVVTAELLDLCRWVAEYYQAPLGEVLKAALPHAFSGSSKTLVHLLLQPDDQRLRSTGMGRSRRAEMIRVLREDGPCTTQELSRRLRVKGIAAIVNVMAAEGLVRTEEILPKTRGGSRSIQVIVFRAGDPAAWVEALANLPARKKGARQILSTLIDSADGGAREITVADLLRKSSAGSAAAHALAKTGLIDIVRREVTAQEEYGTEEQTLKIALNAAQNAIVDRVVAALDQGKHRTFLVHGVTGSGKTQVYIEVIRRTLDAGKNAIVLVPEISLTPQIVRRFKSHFGEQAMVVHSRMAAGDRLGVWRHALAGNCRVVIGPRSAVFAPLPRVGLIVVDEEHETSYKQFDASPRYHARDVAIVRGRNSGAVILLGSATPSVESYHNALTGKFELLEMPERVDALPLPPITILDMTTERKELYAAVKERTPMEDRATLKRFHQPALSRVLRDKILDRLSRREGIILLQNRRGYAPFVICEECGHSEGCSECSVTLTYHMAQRHLRCHYCGLVQPVPTVCPSCGGTALRLQGVGTQRVESELAEVFPDARVLRMDLDTTTRKGAHHRILERFGRREADILLGTQMVAKGLDFPHVTLVGVISADTQMLLPDFRSAERTFQLLTQVAGRAGRSALQGEVIIQTHQPDNYSLRHVVLHDFRSFFEEELEARRALDYPPFSRIVLVETKGEREEDVWKGSERLAERLKSGMPAGTILGPAPAVISRIRNRYRWHVVLKVGRGHDPAGAKARSVLRRAIDELSRSTPASVEWIVDVDPAGML